MESKGEIILYQPDDEVKLDVRLENETVWLNRNQMSVLFCKDVKTISKHVNNALREELSEFPVVANFATTAADGKTYRVEYYSLDMILSVGYRVKSRRGIEFRRWANKVLKEYLLKGYSINLRMNRLEEKLEDRLHEHDRQIEYLTDKVDFFVRTSLPPVEGIFYDGQVVGHHGRPVMSRMKGKSEEKVVAVFVLEGGVGLQRIVRQQRHDFLDFLL